MSTQALEFQNLVRRIKRCVAKPSWTLRESPLARRHPNHFLVELPKNEQSMNPGLLADDTIRRAQCIEILSQARDARALILRDTESFHTASTALERIGQILGGTVKNGLGRYKENILALISEAAVQDDDEAARLFEVVREARNSAVHDGAWARHLSSRLVDLFLILETAIKSKMKLIEDLMVRSVAISESWHLIADARRTMVENSFTCLPILSSSDGRMQWRLVMDFAIVKFIYQAAAGSERKARISTRLASAIADHGLDAPAAICCHPKMLVEELPSHMNHQPVLVTINGERDSRLLGIITPFDLL